MARTKKAKKPPKKQKTENPFEPETCDLHGNPWPCDDCVEELTVKKVNHGKKPRKGKTLPIPGTEAESNAKLDDLALVYYQRVIERTKLSKLEAKSHTALLEAMKAEGVETYRWEANDDRTYILSRTSGKEKVKFDPIKGDD